MIWEVEWHVSAEEALKRLPSWQVAARLCRAVRDFAEQGVGDVRRLGDGQEFRLHVGRYVVRFGVDSESQTIQVWTVFSKD